MERNDRLDRDDRGGSKYGGVEEERAYLQKKHEQLVDRAQHLGVLPHTLSEEEQFALEKAKKALRNLPADVLLHPDLTREFMTRIMRIPASDTRRRAMAVSTTNATSAVAHRQNQPVFHPYNKFPTGTKLDQASSLALSGTMSVGEGENAVQWSVVADQDSNALVIGATYLFPALEYLRAVGSKNCTSAGVVPTGDALGFQKFRPGILADWTAEDKIFHMCESRTERGLVAIPADQQHKYVLVFPEGSEYKSHAPSDANVLFTRHSPYKQGGMLCLDRTRISHNAKAIRVKGCLTEESMVRLLKLEEQKEEIERSRTADHLISSGLTQSQQEQLNQLGQPGDNEKRVLSGEAWRNQSSNRHGDRTGPERNGFNNGGKSSHTPGQMATVTDGQPRKKGKAKMTAVGAEMTDLSQAWEGVEQGRPQALHDGGSGPDLVKSSSRGDARTVADVDQKRKRGYDEIADDDDEKTAGRPSRPRQGNEGPGWRGLNEKANQRAMRRGDRETRPHHDFQHPPEERDPWRGTPAYEAASETVNSGPRSNLPGSLRADDSDEEPSAQTLRERALDLKPMGRSSRSDRTRTSNSKRSGGPSRSGKNGRASYQSLDDPTPQKKRRGMDYK